VTSADLLLATVVVVALLFDFTNGFHDTANAVATSVSTRALSPGTAVTVAALANFAGAFTSTAVATTIGTGILTPEATAHQDVLLAALASAITWNLLTWYLALPSSSSYALVGGLVGSVLMADGPEGIQWSGLVSKVLLPAALAPVLGFAAAFAILCGLLWLVRTRSASRVNRQFRIAQVGAGTLMAFAHGANDAQKTMGVIALALLTAGRTETFTVPTWVVVASATALALGTYIGGWRIMRTIGYRVFRIEPMHGFAAQTAATAVLLGTAAGGFPISSTHVITGSVYGAGSATQTRHVSWTLALRILAVWMVTLPAAAALAALIYLPVRVLG
jgi:PiT family inorganic phosphate transporter